MKKIIYTGLILAGTFINAQVIFGGDTGSASDVTSVLVDFATTESKGIVLPYVSAIPTTPTQGTIILDTSDATAARVKYYNGEWKDLSGQDADVSTEVALQTNETEASDAKVVMGATDSSVDGILVLESTTKAMVLPQVEDVQEIVNPAPGMMVYVNKTGAKRLAVFNGSKWSYWKP